MLTEHNSAVRYIMSESEMREINPSWKFVGEVKLASPRFLRIKKLFKKTSILKMASLLKKILLESFESILKIVGGLI